MGVGGGYAGDGGWWVGGWWRVGVRWVDGGGGGCFFLKHKLCIFWQHQTKQTARLPRTARHIAQEASNSAAMEATQPSQWAPRRRRGPVNIGYPNLCESPTRACVLRDSMLNFCGSTCRWLPVSCAVTSIPVSGLELGIEVEDVDGIAVEGLSSTCDVASITASGL